MPKGAQRDGSFCGGTPTRNEVDRSGEGSQSRSFICVQGSVGDETSRPGARIAGFVKEDTSDSVVSSPSPNEENFSRSSVTYSYRCAEAEFIISAVPLFGFFFPAALRLSRIAFFAAAKRELKSYVYTPARAGQSRPPNLRLITAVVPESGLRAASSSDAGGDFPYLHNARFFKE